jgi:hypothetical protein
MSTIFFPIFRNLVEGRRLSSYFGRNQSCGKIFRKPFNASKSVGDKNHRMGIRTD